MNGYQEILDEIKRLQTTTYDSDNEENYETKVTIKVVASICEKALKKKISKMPIAPKGRIITEGKDKVAREGEK